ncbi:MAG: hypothetical protein L0I24_17425 [Pseudonocardia sp.]|nr:hypothetical protein [Pseudonocardia sp.]
MSVITTTSELRIPVDIADERSEHLGQRGRRIPHLPDRRPRQELDLGRIEVPDADEQHVPLRDDAQAQPVRHGPVGAADELPRGIDAGALHPRDDPMDVVQSPDRTTGTRPARTASSTAPATS